MTVTVCKQGYTKLLASFLVRSEHNPGQNYRIGRRDSYWAFVKSGFSSQIYHNSSIIYHANEEHGMYLWLKWPTRLTLCAFGTFSNLQKINSHVLHCDVFEDLTVVNIPHSLVIPNFGSQQDGSQNNALPVGRADIQLSVGQKTFQIHLGRKCFMRQLIMKDNTSHISHTWPEETLGLW